MAVINTESAVPKQSKIENLLPRTKDGKSFILSEGLKNNSWGFINQWIACEKADGTNMRVHANQNGDFLIGGKSDNANIAGDLVTWIETKLGGESGEDARFILDKLAEIGYEGYTVTLFGEGIGPKLERNRHGLEEKQFMLYDVHFSKDDGRSFFAPPSDIQEIGTILDIPTVKMAPPADIETIYQMVSADEWEERIGYDAEGIVAYPPSPVYDTFGNRMCFKLKRADVLRIAEQVKAEQEAQAVAIEVEEGPLEAAEKIVEETREVVVEA